MKYFYQLRVSKVKRETDEAVSITFDVPYELKDSFKYKHGQFLTIKTNFNDKPVSRAYSISTCPYVDTDLTVTVKEIEDGFVSAFLNKKIKEGDIFEVQQPRGKFTIELKPDRKRLHFLFAGGSGITPIMSILKSILYVETNSKVILVYTNRNENSVIFKEFLNDLEKKYSDRIKIIHIFSKPTDTNGKLTGRINKQIAMDIINSFPANEFDERHFYMCGPNGMMYEIQSALDELRVNKPFIHKESFNAKKSESDKIQMNIPEKKMEEAKLKTIKLKIYSEESEINVNPDETILEAALREGFDSPFSCQIGACATCRAKLISGQVNMIERDALTDEEIEEGYVLTCQAHPISDDVYIDYDDQY